MVTDVYSHILDDDRKNNAQLFREAFYEGKHTHNTAAEPMKLPEGITPEVLAKILAKPELAALLGTVAKSL